MTEPRSESWAMLPRSLIRSGLDSDCKVLYAHVDEASGPRGDWQVGGLQKIADDLGWQQRTVKTHVRHLVAAGLLAVEKRSERAGEHLKIKYQPARGIGRAEDATVPPVQERHRPVSPYKRRPNDSRATQVIAERPALGAHTVLRQPRDMRDTRVETRAERRSLETECLAQDAGLSKSAVSEESGDSALAVVLGTFPGALALCAACGEPATPGTAYCREHEAF